MRCTVARCAFKCVHMGVENFFMSWEPVGWPLAQLSSSAGNEEGDKSEGCNRTIFIQNRPNVTRGHLWLCPEGTGSEPKSVDTKSADDQPVMIMRQGNRKESMQCVLQQNPNCSPMTVQLCQRSSCWWWSSHRDLLTVMETLPR